MTVYQNTPRNSIIPATDKERSRLGIYAPIKYLVIWNNTVQVGRVNDSTQGGNSGGGLRDQIREFSRQSRQRYLHTILNSDHEISWLLTLTYPREFPSDGRIVKRQLNRFFMWLKKWLRTVYDLGYEYIWRLEFQRRGAPHLHIYLVADFEDLGYSVTTVKRPNPRKHQTERYETIKPIERKIRRQWLEIIDDPISELGWGGLSAEDYDRKARAHSDYNAADCLELLLNGKAYAVAKESSYSHPKAYQNIAPPDFESVGRWWGCSRGFAQRLEDCLIVEMSDPLVAKMLSFLDWPWLNVFTHIPKFLYRMADQVKDFLADHDIHALDIPLEKAKEIFRALHERNGQGVRNVDDFSRGVIAAKIYNRQQRQHDRRHYNVHVNLPPLPRRSLPLAAPNAPPEDKQPSLF